MVGRLVAQKNPLLFVAAAAALRERLPTARFALVGDGPLRGEVEAAVRAAGLGDALRAGRRARATCRALLRDADLFWLTSDWEGLPNAVIEAMACGLPVVATDVGGTARADRRRRRGLRGRAPAIATRLVARSLDDPRAIPALHARMRAAARARAERFGVEQMVQATQAVYDARAGEAGGMSEWPLRLGGDPDAQRGGEHRRAARLRCWRRTIRAERLEVLVVDGDSNDDSAAVVERYAAARSARAAAAQSAPHRADGAEHRHPRRARRHHLPHRRPHRASRPTTCASASRPCSAPAPTTSAARWTRSAAAGSATRWRRPRRRASASASYFHFGTEEREVDTVYLGMWPRRVFERVGLFDEELVRNQDDEFNYRLRKAGGRIVLDAARCAPGTRTARA